MKTYTIIGGTNGVGKSSFLGCLNEQRDDLGVIVDADKINLRFDGDKVKGGKAASQMISDCLEREISFTQETTLSGRKTLKTVKEAREKNYFVRLYYIGISSAQESLLRIENRVKKGGHGIPESDVLRRYKSRFEDLLRILPYCDEALLFDNENGFVKVAEYRNGQLRAVGEYRPEWLKELIEVVK